MSGLKQGALTASLERLQENLSRYVELARGTASRFGNGKSAANERSVQDIRRMLSGIPDASSRAQEFAGDECRQLSQDIQDALSALQAENDQMNAVRTMQDEVNQTNEEINSFLADIRVKSDAIQARAQYKIDTTTWSRLALDREVEQIDALSREVTSRIRSLSGEVSAKSARRHDLTVASQGRLESLSARVRRLAERRSEIERLAENRYEAKRLLEAQQAASVQSDGEIKLLEQRIGTMEYERFLPGGYAPLANRMEAFRENLSNGDFPRCAQDGPGIVEDLRAFSEELETLAQAFQAAEKDAQAKLKAAQDEIGAIDLADLRRWSQKPAEIQQVLDDLKKSEEEIDEISATGNRAVEFQTPVARIGSAIESLRKLVDEATDNHARYDARDGIRKAIRDALKTLKYDKPEYSLDTLPDGSVDDLSDLVIYARNPANTANMRLNVNLDGKLSFEVFREDEEGNELEVTQQDAVACHGAVLAFGEQMEAAGFHFQVTDWGKAKDLPQAQEQGRITWDDADPGRQGKSSEMLRERSREQERQKEQKRL